MHTVCLIDVENDTFSVDLNHESKRMILDFALDGDPGTKINLKDVSFGYKITDDKGNVKEESWPVEPLKLGVLSPGTITSADIALSIETDYEIYCWYQNKENRQEKTLKFNSDRPYKEYDSMVWNEKTEEWDMLKPYPTDTDEPMVWNEEKLQYERLPDSNEINVLDKGYVRLVDHMGNDLSVVNAARVSYDKEAQELSDRDRKLINFLIREKHTSPFRHASMTFEVYAPLVVARQWWKYAVSSTHVDDQNGWNESSRRYITENEEFYIPTATQWRSKPENSKQGSGEPVDESLGQRFTDRLEEIVRLGEEAYESAMKQGIAPELARLFLPAYGMYVRWRWTTSLQGVMTFLEQRLPHDAQSEIREYADAVLNLSKDIFPATFNSYLNLDS